MTDSITTTKEGEYSPPLEGLGEVTPIMKWTQRYIKETGILVPDPKALTIYLQLRGFKPLKAAREEYRNIQALSFSSLMRLKKQMMGIEVSKPSYKAFALGSVLHQQVLEPHLMNIEDYNLTPAQLRDMSGMIRALRKEQDIYYALRNGVVEKEIIWRDRVTKALLKGKVDLSTTRQITDIKSTAANTLEEFMESVKRYSYAIQATMYMDGMDKDVFIFKAVQKRYPYQVFTVKFHRQDEEIRTARKKYRFIISKVKQLGLKPEAW